MLFSTLVDKKNLLPEVRQRSLHIFYFSWMLCDKGSLFLEKGCFSFSKELSTLIGNSVCFFIDTIHREPHRKHRLRTFSTAHFLNSASPSWLTMGWITNFNIAHFLEYLYESTHINQKFAVSRTMNRLFQKHLQISPICIFWEWGWNGHGKCSFARTFQSKK